MPRVAFVNKMDKIGADFQMCLDSIAHKLTKNAVPIQMPNGAANEFKGVVDLVAMKYITFEGENGMDQKYHDIPADILSDAQAMREVMLDKLS